MFGFLISILLIASSLAENVQLNVDSKIYDAVINSLEKTKAEENALEKELSNIIRRTTSVCYEELGCFDKNGPFKHLKLLPQPPEEVDTKFFLYTRNNIDEPEIIHYKNRDAIKKSKFNPKVPIKYIIHGFGAKFTTWVREMKTAFLEKEDVNVIIIDWSAGCKIPHYIKASVNTELVGAEAALLFSIFQDMYGIEEKDLHVIGFSLGAHVAGFIGKRMKALRKIRPGRITGLDPARLFFEEFGADVHLYKDDADYVDIVHTNTDFTIYGGVGIQKPIGHADYYPNGGKRQPGCSSTIFGAITDIVKNERAKVCNHERAVHLFTDSILNDSPCEFTGYRCDNYTDFELGKCMSCKEQCGRMGYKAHGSGVYYLMTDSKKPYCAGLVKLKVKFSTDFKKSYGALILTLVGNSGNTKNVTLTKKDEKLSPGAEIVQVMPASDVLKELNSISVLYRRYSGMITKGKDTYGLASITIEDPEGNYIFKRCGDTIILKDQEIVTLKQTTVNC